MKISLCIHVYICAIHEDKWPKNANQSNSINYVYKIPWYILNTNPSLANFQRFTSWFFHSWKFSPVEKSTRETLNLPILSTSGQIYGRYRHCIAWRCNRKKNFVAKWWSKDLGKRKHYRWQANTSCTTRWLHVDDEAVLTKLYVCWHVGGEK